MTKKLLPIVIILILLIVKLSGCSETAEDAEQNTIIGTWSMIDNYYDISFKYVYIFYENSSFFSGVLNLSSLNYELSIWGNYSINESRITLTETEKGSASSLKYSFSKDGNTLLLYYEDEINFDTLTRET